MNRIALICSLLIGMILFSSCPGSVCPPDKKTGAITLSAETRSKIPYQGTERLTFSSQKGQQMNLQSSNGQEDTMDRLCYQTICTEPQFDGKSTCEYYEGEANRFIFTDSNNSFLLDLLFHLEVYKSGAPNFYEAMQLSISSEFNSANGRRILGQRFTGDFQEQEINLQNKLEYRTSVTLNGKSFSDVYYFESTNSSIYYTDNQGLIGFKFNQDTWVLN